MARKQRPPVPPTADPARTGLFISRLQVITARGHQAALDHMYRTCGRAIVGIGSSDAEYGLNNPFSAAQRAEALDILARHDYGANPFRVLTLRDIYAEENSLEDWPRYVLKMAMGQGLPPVTDLFVGSVRDARHFIALWKMDTSPEKSVRRLPDGDHGACWVTWENASGQRIHVREREQGDLRGISASVARESIRERTPDWKAVVPEALHTWYEWNYPAEQRLALCGTAFPDPETVPVDTRFTNDGGDTYILRPDGVWRRWEPRPTKSLSD